MDQLQNNDDDDLFDSSYEDEECDAESLASLQNEEHYSVSVPEKILAETHWRSDIVYLVKWDKCPLFRSSWESEASLIDSSGTDTTNKLLEIWKVERQLQKEGKKPAFDLEGFLEALNHTERLEKGRRNLRRWKRQLKGILAAITVDKEDRETL